MLIDHDLVIVATGVGLLIHPRSGDRGYGGRLLIIHDLAIVAKGICRDRVLGRTTCQRQNGRICFGIDRIL